MTSRLGRVGQRLLPHLRYLKYVLIHKLYVFRAGRLVNPSLSPRWWWRLLVHDWSKFRPSEWRPYVSQFYGTPSVRRETAAYQRAWLLHQHRNPHHWQHWVLREDSGKTIILTPPREIVDEMLADWIGAGLKILRWPTLAECVAETAIWYSNTRQHRILRDIPRAYIENTLIELLREHVPLTDRPELEPSPAAHITLTIPET